MPYISPKDLYNKVQVFKMLDRSGKITFDYSNVKFEVSEKSAIGDLFQEWLGRWMLENDIEYRTNPNTQKFPDYYLHETSNSEDLLELKTFDSDAGAAFDVANFDTYTRSLLAEPYKINADYLIFSYTFREGVFKVADIWIKKIWEITGPMNDRPINMQVKQGVFVNIRPVKWYSKRARFKPFGDKKTFLEALHKTILMDEKHTEWDKSTWLEKVVEFS